MTIGDVCVNKSSIKRANTCFSPDEKIEYVDISSIDNEDNKVISTTIVEFGGAPSRAQQKIEYGDILVSLVRPNLRNVAVFEKKISNAVASSGFCVLRCKSIVLNRYIFTVVRSKIFVDYLVGRVTGAAYPSVSESNIKDFVIPIPPLEEQERIVAELDLLTGVIEKQKAQLKELDNLAQSIFYDMFGDVVNNEKAWNVVPLRLLCSITSSKRIFASEYCQSGIPFFRGKEVSEKSFGLKTSVELFISKKRYDEIRDAYGVPSMGDILLTAVGTIGNVWVVDDDAPFYFKDGNILWLKLREGINPVYFRFVLLKLVDAYKSSMAKGCAYNALTIVNLKEMPTVDTPYCFQNEFAHKIQSIENQKTLIKKSIEETQKLFDYTMDKYFG